MQLGAYHWNDDPTAVKARGRYDEADARDIAVALLKGEDCVVEGTTETGQTVILKLTLSDES